MVSAGPPERAMKRHKGDGPMGGPPPDAYHGAYPPGRFQQGPYGPGGPPMGPRAGYMGWQAGQYGNPPPPHSWNHGSTPTPGGMYPQQGGPAMTPDRAGYGSAYPRGPPMQGPPGRRPGKPPAPRGPPGKGPEGPDGPEIPLGP